MIDADIDSEGNTEYSCWIPEGWSGKNCGRYTKVLYEKGLEEDQVNGSLRMTLYYLLEIKRKRCYRGRNKWKIRFQNSILSVLQVRKNHPWC